MTDASVEWAYHHGTVRWLRWLAYAVAGVLGGVLLAFLLVALAVLAVSLGGAVFAGDWGLLALVALLALVGGPFSLLYLLPMLRDADQRPGLQPDRFRIAPRLDRRRLLAASVVGALALVGAYLVHPILAGSLVGLALLGGVVFTACSTAGTLDGEALTLTVRGTERSLVRTRAVRRYEVGPLVWFRLLPTRGPGNLSAPRSVLVPAAVADDAERVLRDAAATEYEGREPNRAVRVVAALFALGCWGAAALVVTVWSLGLFAVGLLTVLGGIFGWIAVFEG